MKKDGLFNIVFFVFKVCDILFIIWFFNRVGKKKMSFSYFGEVDFFVG